MKIHKSRYLIGVLIIASLLMIIPPTIARAAPALAIGNGLHAVYTALGGGPVTATVDGEGPIEHGWIDASVCSGSVRYEGVCGLWAGIYDEWAMFEETLTGYIEAPATGHYIFHIYNDDYLDITINGIHQLRDGESGATMEMDLVEGNFYAVSMLYKNRGGSNDLNLHWTRPDELINVPVPKQYLYTHDPSTPPTLPASFYGEIHITNNPPVAGDYLDAYVSGNASRVARTTISGTDPLVYGINVPGDDFGTTVKDGGEENDVVTFKIGTRIVGTGVWHGGTNVSLDLHPPEPFPATASGVAGTAVNFDASAVTLDWGSDASVYQWDWDNNGTYDESGAVVSHTWSTIGAKSVGLKVTDAQGGEGFKTVDVTISKGTAVVTLGSLSQTYTGSPLHATVVTDPVGLTVDITYDGFSTEPTDAGSYAVVATVNDANYDGTASDTLVISKAPVTVNITNTSQRYDGTPKPVTVTTDPVGHTATVTYDGLSTVPSAAGDYAVVATVNEPNYAGSASTTLHILLLPVHNETQDLYYGTIQAAIDDANSGDVIYIPTGTYVENVLVDQSVTLYGDGTGTIVMPAVSNPNPCTGSSLCGGAASNVFLVQANDVVIHDLLVDGNNPDLTGGIVRGGADLDARNGIIKNTAGTYNNLEVYNVTVQNIYLRGIYSPGGTFNFHDNTVTNVQGDGYSIGMFAWYGPGTMANNTVSYANDAISANHSKGIQFLNNTVTHSLSGIHTDNSNDGGGVADLIQDNSVDCTGTSGAYGIWTFVPYVAPTVNHNTVTNCSISLSAWGQGAPVTTLFTNNTATGNAHETGSVGAYITTDLISWGYADVSVRFTGNIITGFETGVFFAADQQSWNPEPYVAETIKADFSCNQIDDNTFGMNKDTSGTYLIDASPNWWGSASGPGPVGPGTGDTIAAGISYFPWSENTACTLFSSGVALVETLDPSWDAVGGGGVFAAYIGPTEYGYVSPGSTTNFDGRAAGLIKAGIAVDPISGNYEDEGLLGFKVYASISDFASQPLSYVVENETGTNPLWVRIRLADEAQTQYQFVPASYGVGGGYHTIDAASGSWQLMDINGNAVGPMMTLAQVAAANPGAFVDRVYLTMGIGNSYNVSPGVGTVAWVDKVTIGNMSYDFVATTLVSKLMPDWTSPGGGGVFSTYVGPTAYGYVSPGATAFYDGREAGIIKAGINIDVDGHYWDEGLFGFKPYATIDLLAAEPLRFDVVNAAGVNPVWMTMEIDTGVAGDRADNTIYQFVPTTNPGTWHTVDAAAGLWQKWNNNEGDVTGNPLITLDEVAAAHSGMDVVRVYLRLGMGDSYNNGGTGTIGWVDKATIGDMTYDFVTTSFLLTVSKTGTGTGTITSSPIGIDCGTTCSASFVYPTMVTLTATPNPDSTFTGWSGETCSGTGTCTVTMDAARSVSAAFTQNVHSISLQVGWNLVSFRLHPLNTTVSAVLSSISGNYDLVYAWDSTGGHSGSGNWLKADNVPMTADTLTNLDETMGFWIHMTTADTLDVVGSVPSVTNVTLNTEAGGWNLVGYASPSGLALPGALSNHGVSTNFTLVYAYHPADTSDPWKLFDRTGPVWVNDLPTLDPGWGYWVKVTVDNLTWDIE